MNDLEKGLLKSEKIVTISNIISLALNALGLGSVVLAMILDQAGANVPYENLLDLTRAGVIVGTAGIAGTIVTGILEEKNAKLKRKVEKQKIIEAGVEDSETECEN